MEGKTKNGGERIAAVEFIKRCALCLTIRPGKRPLLLVSQREVSRSFAAVAARLDVESNFLTIGQIAQTSALNCADVDEYVLGTAFRLDEAEAFSCVEPFHSAVSHVSLS